MERPRCHLPGIDGKLRRGLNKGRLLEEQEKPDVAHRRDDLFVDPLAADRLPLALTCLPLKAFHEVELLPAGWGTLLYTMAALINIQCKRPRTVESAQSCFEEARSQILDVNKSGRRDRRSGPVALDSSAQHPP